jgi:hypothetical protein
LDQWDREESHLTEGLLQMSRQERTQLKRYREIRARNMHKMLPIPVCKF